MDAASKFAKRRAQKASTPITDEEAAIFGAIDHPMPENALKEGRARQPRQKLHHAETELSTPESMRAEMGVLGSVLMASKYMYEVESRVGVEFFHHPAHQTIFRALKEMHSDNSPIDFISLTQYLEDQHTLDSVGGAAYITELHNFLPTPSNIGYYLDILCEKHRTREILNTCNEAAEKAADPSVASTDLLDTLEDKIRALRTMAGRNGRLPDLDDMAFLTGDKMPIPPAELVQGLLHQGSKMIIGGPSKARKTYGLMDLGISVATGTEWWGSKTVKGKVCYINFEIQKPFFAKRYDDICRKKDVTPEPGMFMCWTLRGMVEGMERMVDQLIKSLLQYDFVLIIVDPIYKALGDRDENKAGDVASLLNELERIAVRTGAAIAFCAHFSKGNQAGKESIDRIGGSGVFARDPDSILAMTPHEEEECFTIDATLRNFPPMPPFVVKWERSIFIRDEHLDAAALRRSKNFRQTREGNSGQFQAKYSVQDILDCLKDAETSKSATELQVLVKATCGMGPSKFWMLWKEAKKSPFVVCNGSRFHHTENIPTA